MTFFLCSRAFFGAIRQKQQKLKPVNIEEVMAYGLLYGKKDDTS
jgi:hypothetical protein